MRVGYRTLMMGFIAHDRRRHPTPSTASICCCHCRLCGHRRSRPGHFDRLRTGSGRTFPSRPIKLVIDFLAGGPTDITMQALTDNVSKILGQVVVVENKPGAGGTLPAQQLQSSPADGYTLAQIPLGVFRLPYTTKINLDPIKYRAYVLNVTGYAFGLVVPADSPLKTWTHFVGWAKASPGKLSYGATGTLTSPHLTMG